MTDDEYNRLSVSMLHYVDQLFERDRQARKDALDALQAAQHDKASRMEFYFTLFIALCSLAVSILKVIGK